MKIYLAGPDVFRADAVEHFKVMKSMALQYGFQALSPFDNEASDAREIYHANLALIRECDFVVANIEPFRGPSCDVGTAFEIGYGKALGKDVLMYTSSLTDYKNRATGSDEFPSVEDFGLIDNLMIDLSGPVYRSYETILQVLKRSSQDS